ncbi:hypothetical protein MRX96_010486 [Rhipicephalus microplus]
MRYQRDYEVCVSMVIRDVCGSTEYAQEDSLEVVKFTRDYLKLGAFLRESVSSRADPRCFRNYVNKKLKECEGLIVAFPSPQLSKSYHGAQLEESCRTLQDYVFCANMKLNKVCGSLRNNPKKGCTKQGIVSKLKQCVGFLFVHVVKHATDYDVYNDDTCKYVQEYQQCVADMLNTSCSRQAVLMKLDDIKYYTSHLYSKYEHLCRSAPFCEEAVLVKNLSQCTGYITVNVLPHLKKTSGSEQTQFGLQTSYATQRRCTSGYLCVQGFITHKAAVNAVSKTDRRSLKLACSAVMDYQRCVQGIVSEVCQDRQYMPETTDVKHYTRDLYFKYYWTCQPDSSQGKKCDESKLEDALHSCQGFLLTQVLVNANGSLLRMTEACRQVCHSAKSVDETSNKNYLSSDHRFVCEAFSRQEPSCNKEGIIQVISECSGYMRDYILPNIIEYGEEATRSTACKGFVNYKECVNAATEKICPKSRLNPTDAAQIESYKDQLFQKSQLDLFACEDVINDDDVWKYAVKHYGAYNWTCRNSSYNALASTTVPCLETPEIRRYTHEIYDQYKWVCDVPDSSDIEEEIACNDMNIVQHLKNCYPFVAYNVIPNVQHTDIESGIRTACSGVRDYQLCINTVLQTCKHNATSLDDMVVKYYTNEVFSKYNWTCETETECDEQRLEETLNECAGIVEYDVKPYTDNPRDTERMKTACMNLREAQNCAKLSMFQVCDNLAVPDSANIKRLLYHIIQKYNWTCVLAVDYKAQAICEKSSLLENITECMGFITISQPSQFHSSGSRRSESLCSHYQDYRNCVADKITSACQTYDDLLEHPDVLNATTAAVTAVKTACSTKVSVGSVCSTSSLRKQYTTCMGYLRKYAIPRLHDTSSPANLKIGCKYLENYKKCLALKTDITCTKLKNWANNAVKRQFERPLEIALRAYQQCLAIKLSPCVARPGFVSNLEIRNFTVNTIEQYKWVCAYVPQAICREREAVAMFQECFKYLANHSRKSLASNGRSKPRYFENMCSDVKAYQFCIHSAMETTCKQELLIPESSEVRMFTRNYFNAYNWSCDLFMGNYAKMDSAHSSKGLACTKAELLSSLRICAGFLQVRVYPKLDKFVNNAELSDACSGLTDFEYCTTMQINKQCVGRNLQVLQDPEILFFTKVLPSDYAWVCTTQSHTEPLCSEERLMEDLKECYKIIQEKVTPYLHDQRSQVKTVRNEALGLLACRSVLDYQSCVAKKTEHCARSSPLLQKSEVKYYISDVFHMYNWTCYQKALTCRATDVAKSLETCQGFLDIGVLPFSGNNTKLNQIYAACRGTQEFQGCVKNTIWRRCPGSSDALNSAEVMRYTEELFDKYNYTCQAMTDMNNVSICNKDPLEDFKTCTGFLTTKVVTSLETIDDPDALVQACRSFLDYRECIENNYANHCRSKTLPGVAKYLEYTADLYQRYAWTCRVIRPSKGKCQESKVAQDLRQCLGFITEKVVHVSQYRKSPLKLNDACRSLEEFKTCIYTKVFETCPRNAERSSVLRSEEVEHYLEMYNEYKKECDLLSSALQDRTCSEENLYLHYKTCIGFSTMHVDPYIKNMTFPTDSYRSLACSAYKDYSACLFKKTEDICGDQNGYVHYDNVRYFMGEVHRKHDHICRPSEHECRLTEVLDVLSECRGFLHLNEPANPSDYNNYVKATHTCRGLQSFKSCVDTTINNLCSKNVLIPKSNEVQEYKELAVLKYKWACEVLDGLKDNDCSDANINHHLRQCSGFLGTVVEPIARDFVSPPEEMDLACQFTKYYQQCVQSFLRKRECKNSPLQPEMTIYTVDLYYKFAWTCKRPEHCEKAELLKRLKYCRGIITHNVHPFMDKKNRTSLARACRGLEDYQLCAVSTSRTYCNNTDTLMSHEVRYYTSGIYEHYKWVCSSSAVAPRCTKAYIVSRLEECLGFLEHMVLPVVQARHKDDFTLRSACRGVEYYQQCVQQKSKICANETDFYKNDETKYLTETLYSKYNWTCSTKAESLLCEDSKLLRNLSECVGKYKWVCDSTVEKNSYCDEGDLKASLSECYGFVRSIVMPNAAQPNVNTKLQTACLGIREYQACVHTRIKAKCEDNEVIPEDPEIRRYMFDVPTKYLWTCEDNQYRSKCTEETFVESLQECVGFITELVAPLARKSNDISKLDSACGSLEAYASCVLSKIKRCEGSPSLMSLSLVRHYTDQLYEKYKWVCDVRKKEVPQCFNKVLPLFKECVGFINQRTIPNIRMTDDDHRMKIACSGVMAYQKCIESSVERSCAEPRGNENVEDYKYYTQVLFNKYNWICRLVLKKLETCKGFITLNVDPYISDGAVGSVFMQTACAAISDFRECVRVKLDDRCSNLDSIEGIQEYLLDIPSKYSKVCEVTRISTSCGAEKLVPRLEMCYKILKRLKMPETAPYEIIGNASTICDAYKQYNICIINEIRQVCGRDRVVARFEKIRPLLQYHYNSFKWACESQKSAGACNEENLERDLSGCLGFINTKVSLYSYNELNVHDIRTACNAFQDYISCVKLAVASNCGHYFDALQHERLKPYVVEPYKRYKWVCRKLPPQGKNYVGQVPSVCNTVHIVNNMTQCLGYLKVRVTSFARVYNSVAFSRQVCRGLTDYQRCIDNMIPSECLRIKDLLENTEIKYFHSLIYSKYAWICESIPSSENRCTSGLLLPKLKECKGFISFEVIPLSADSSSVTNLQHACRGLYYYQKCTSRVISEENCGNIEKLNESRTMQAHLDLLKKYSFVCTVPENSKLCKISGTHLRECLGILETVVIPSANLNASRRNLSDACKAANYYEACVNEEVSDSCSTSSVSTIVEEAKEFFQPVAVFNKICAGQETEASTCTEEALLENMIQCTSMITSVVMPMSNNVTACDYASMQPHVRSCFEKLTKPESFAKLKESNDAEGLASACRYLHYYTTCINQEFTEICGKTPKTLSMPEMIDVGEKYKFYEEVCKADASEDLPSCSKETFQEKAKTCFEAYIAKVVIPHAKASSAANYSSLMIACTAVHEYQDCVLTKLVATCPEEYKRNDRLLETFTDGVYGMYNWTCDFKSPQCTEEELQQQFQLCHKLVEAYVVPNIQNVSDAGQLRTACTYTRKYQDCLGNTLSNLCKDNESLTVTSLNELTQNKYSMYNWTCEIKAVSCMEDFISAQIVNCTALLTNLVLPYAKKGATWSQLKTACKGHHDYQSCVLEQGFRYCEDGTNDAKLLQAVTNGSFSAYSWTCETQGGGCGHYSVLSKMTIDGDCLF